MRKVVAASLLGLVLVFSRVGVLAQPPAPKPGPEIEKLKQLEGTWDTTIHGKEGESKGTATYKMGLGGLWLRETFTADFAGKKFEGRGLMSYDSANKKYVGVWVDSMATVPMLYEGNFDKSGKIMTTTGTMPMPDGKTAKVTMTSERKDADNMIFTMSMPGPDGKSLEAFKITYKRKVK